MIFSISSNRFQREQKTMSAYSIKHSGYSNIPCLMHLQINEDELVYEYQLRTRNTKLIFSFKLIPMYLPIITFNFRRLRAEMISQSTKI